MRCPVICGQMESHRKPIPETYRESDAFNAVHSSYEVDSARALFHLTSYCRGVATFHFTDKPYAQQLEKVACISSLVSVGARSWESSETSVAASIPG